MSAVGNGPLIVMLMIFIAVNASYLSVGTAVAEPSMDSVPDLQWSYDGCIDDDGIVHTVYSTQEGLVFADVYSGIVENPRTISTEDTQEACMELTKSGSFLIAYIVEEDFFNTALKTILYDGKDVLDSDTLLSGSAYHDPTMTYKDNLLYLALEQGGSGEDSNKFSSDIILMSSSNNGGDWTEPTVLFDSMKDESKPSIRTFFGRLCLSFIQGQSETYSQEGNAWEAEDDAVMISYSSSPGVWSKPYRLSHDIAEVSNPCLVPYQDRLAIIWETNKGENGMENVESFSSMIFNGYLWSDALIFRTDHEPGLVPIFVQYADILMRSSKPIPDYLLVYTQLDSTGRDPSISLSGQVWSAVCYDANDVLRNNVTIRNLGNSLLTGSIEVPKRTDCIVVSASAHEFEVMPDEETTISLTVEVDRPGKYSLTVYFESNDADNAVLPYYISVDVKEPDPMVIPPVTIPKVPLRIVSVDPLGTSVTRDAPITVRFSQPVDDTTFLSALSANPEIPAMSLTWNSDWTAVTIQHGELEYDTTYELSVDMDIRSLNSTSLERSYFWNFTTSPGPVDLWTLYGASVDVNADKSVDVSARGLKGLMVYVVIEDVGSFQLMDGEINGTFKTTVPANVLAWERTYSYHFSNISGGIDLQSNLSGEFTTPEGPDVPPEKKNDKDEDKTNIFAIIAVVAMVIIGILLVVIFFLGRSRSKSGSDHYPEMSVFVAMILLATVVAPMFGSGQEEDLEEVRLIDEELAESTYSRINNTEDMTIVSTISLKTPTSPLPGGISVQYTEASQVFFVSNQRLDGIYFHAERTGTGYVPLDVTVKDFTTQRVIGHGRVQISEAGEYMLRFDNNEPVEMAQVDFSTRDSIMPDPREVRIGCVRDPSLNVSEVQSFSRFVQGGRMVLREMYNHDPIALGARYFDPKVSIVSLQLDKRSLLIDKEGDSINGTLTVINNLNMEIPLRVKVVTYDATGDERRIADILATIPPMSASGGISFEIKNDMGFAEGKQLVMVGLYNQDSLIYRYGYATQEQYFSTFLAANRRIADVTVLPTDRIRPGGYFNVAILKIDGIGREVDDIGVQSILDKFRYVAQEYALSYDVRTITDFRGLTDLMASGSEDYALINTHGSIIPLPDEYLQEFTGTKDTVLLMHFNEYKEKPMDSSAYGNIVENYPKSKRPENAFWVEYDGPSSKPGMMAPLFVNGLVDLPSKPDKTTTMVTDLKFTMNVKVMDLPSENERSQIAYFWNQESERMVFFSMGLWNSRENNSAVELEVSIQNGTAWERRYFSLPYMNGLDIGEWITIDCSVDREDPSDTIAIRVIDRYGSDVLNQRAGVAIVEPQMDSRTFDSLVLANIDNNGSIAWKPQPFEAIIGGLEYYLLKSDVQVDGDSWDLRSFSPVHKITSYFGRLGYISGSLYSMHGVYKPQFRNAYSFLGNQWLEVINNDRQKLSEFTIEFMMRMDERPLDKEVWTIVSKTGKDTPNGYLVEIEGAGISNTLRFAVGDGVKYHVLEYGDITMPAIGIAAWHKVCAIYDGEELILQIDGQEVATKDVNATVVYENSPIRIGGTGPEKDYKGLIDELIISKGFDNTNHNIKYADWLSKISTWISSSHSVWVNPTGYPLGYLGMTGVLPIYYGETLFKTLLAPLTHTPGEFLNSGSGATRTPQGIILDDEFESLSLPDTIDYDLSCSASREGAVIPLYYDEDSGLIPSGAVKFGEGAYAFSTSFSPDITVALSMIRLPNDYLMNILNSEHYKGEDIIVASHIENPTDEIETYFVNLTVADPFGREYTAHSKNVTILPGKEAEVHLLFQPKKSTYPKGTYRLFLNVERFGDGAILDVWGDDDDESRELLVNLIDDVELEILDHADEISHNGTLKVPVRVINHGALPSYVNIELSVLSPSGGVFNVALEDRIMVSSHKSKVVELVWDPAKAVEGQASQNLVVDLPFGQYKFLVAMYDAESVLYTSSVLNAQTKTADKVVYVSDDMEHLEGARSETDGWSIDRTALSVPGYLNKGTVQNDLEDGDYIAQFDLMIDNNNVQNGVVANISVWFGDTVIAYRNVERFDFINPNTYQFFDVPFSTVGRRHQSMSFRTEWMANCYLKQDKVEVIPYRTSNRVENLELRTKPIDFEYSSFSILAETRITAYLTESTDHYVSAEIFYEVGDLKGSFDVPKTDQCYSFTLFHYPKDVIYITTKGLGGGKDLQLSTVRTVETFIVQKKGSKLIDVEHGYFGDVVDITITESISNVKIKDTLTLEDLSVYRYTAGVKAGFDDVFSKPYVEYNASKDWAEFEVDIPSSKVQRLTIEAFEEPGKTIVLKCLINTTKAPLVLTFAFLGRSGTWTQNSTNVELASGHYTLRVSQARDGYHARMYPEIFVTPLPFYDHGEESTEIEQAGNRITVCVLGLGFSADLSFIPKIPSIPIPGLEVPKLSIGDTLKLTVVDSARKEVESLVLGGSYFLRIRVEYTHEMKDSKKSINETHKSGLKYSWKKANDKPGIESLSFIVGVELGFVYSEDNDTGIRYPDIDSFGIYELGVKIKIRLKAWSNPGAFVLDICTGGSGSMTPGVSELLNAVFGGLRAVGFDIGAGLYLMIEATLIFKPYFKLIFDIYPLGEVWAKIVLNFWFFKFTIIDLQISLVLPIGLTVVADSGFSPWNVYIQFFIKLGGKLVLFMIKIFEDSIRINLFTIWISQGTPKTRAAEIAS